MSTSMSNLDIALLRDLYTKDGLSMKDIAIRLEIPPSRVRRIMVDNNIARRPSGSCLWRQREIEEQVIALTTRQKRTRSEVASLLGMKYSTFYSYLKRHSISASFVDNTNIEKRERVRKMYEEAGMTMKQIGEKFGITSAGIWYLLAVHGVPRRTSGPREGRKGRRNSNWKEDGIGYRQQHMRVEQARGRPTCCESCGKSDPDVRYVWHSVEKDYGNTHAYKRLCVRCHMWTHKAGHGFGKYSQFCGVSFKKGGLARPWVAQLVRSPEHYYLGCFATEEEAACAYDTKAIELYGANARLNFPEESQ